MARMHWSYADLLQCPRRHYEALVAVLNEENDANSR
jgi:hypothetical protein